MTKKPKVRPAEGRLVQAGNARAEATRIDAARWHWVHCAWYDDQTPLFLRGGQLAPERFHFPKDGQFLLDQIRALHSVKLEVAPCR